MSDLLDARDLTADERIAIADEPRNGIWWQPSWMLGGPADKRPLTQEQTDRLIALELRSHYNDFPHGEVFQLTEQYKPAPIDLVVKARKPRSSNQVPANPFLWRESDLVTLARTAHRQRNGIHSDPVIRLLAFRVWGERDRSWFKLADAIAKAAEVASTSPLAAARDAEKFAMSMSPAGSRDHMIAMTRDLVEWFTPERG